MALLENLVVKFTGDSSGLVTAAKLGTRAVRTVGRASAQLARIGAVGAVGLAAAAGVFIQSSRKQIDETRKLALNLRQTVADTQKLAIVGELTGTNLETMSIAVQQATRAVGDAKRGNKSYSDALRVLGLNVNALAKMEAGLRFRTIISAMGKLENKTVQASVAALLLGRGWRSMNVLIEDGGKSFGRAARIIDGLGLGLKETDTSTEQLNDNLSVLVAIGTALRNKVFEALAPLMVPLVQNLIDMAEAAIVAAGGGEKLAATWAGNIVSAINGTVTFFNNLVTVVRTTWSVIEPVLNNITDGIARTAAIAEGFKSGGISGGAAAIQAQNFTAEDFVKLLQPFAPGLALGRALFSGDGGGAATSEGGEVQQKQLTEQEQQTQLLRRLADGTFTNVAVAG